MQVALRLNTTILPGHRIEITAPELADGTSVELIVIPNLSALPDIVSPYKDIIEFLDSLTPVERTPEQWADIERDFQEDRSSWDF